MENIMVSIIIPTYNHEKYIKQTIESVLMQKVDFSYEVLIGEDCSTDKTADVLKEAEKHLPKNFKVFYREVNLGGKNFTDLFKRSKGKYMIILEGDDYWTYENKLKTQVEFLEKNNSYFAVSHNSIVVDGLGRKIDNYEKLGCWYRDLQKEEYTFSDWRDGILSGQCASILFRNYYKDGQCSDIPVTVKYVGDQKRNLLFLLNGQVKCIRKKWSAYRYVTSGGSSWASVHRLDNDYLRRQLIYYRDLKNYVMTETDVEFAKMAVETRYLYTSLIAAINLNNPNMTLIEWGREFWDAKYKWSCIQSFIVRLSRKVLILCRGHF